MFLCTHNSVARDIGSRCSPHRQAPQTGLQQNSAYNPFSDESKAMIRGMGNVELFEFCEKIPKVQCSECLLSWNQGTIYCTCGHLSTESESSQNFHQWRLDAFSVPHYVIKKERLRGARHGKTEARRSISWPTMRGGGVSKRILMGFTIASNEIQFFVIRNSKIGWTEDKCIEMDKSAQENHSCCPSSEEYERCKKNWYISVNKSGRNASMKLRSDFREAVTILNRLHLESGEERPEPILFYQYQR